MKNAFYIKKGIMQVAIGNEICKEKTVSFIRKGDCLLTVGDEELVKIHFHTNAP